MDTYSRNMLGTKTYGAGETARAGSDSFVWAQTASDLLVLTESGGGSGGGDGGSGRRRGGSGGGSCPKKSLLRFYPRNDVSRSPSDHRVCSAD